MMRIVVTLAAALLLTGCNVVVSQTPLFTAADEAGAPPLRPGLWRVDDSPECAFNEKAPLAEWPSCARGLIVQADEVGYFDDKDGKRVWSHQPLVFVAGEPRILQARLGLGGDIKADSPPFVYAGGRAAKMDAQGRIIAATFWIVKCGVPRPDQDPAGPGLSHHLLPGLTAKEPVCTTTSPAVLRAAAKASEAWKDEPLGVHWLRDGDS